MTLKHHNMTLKQHNMTPKHQTHSGSAAMNAVVSFPNTATAALVVLYVVLYAVGRKLAVSQTNNHVTNAMIHMKQSLSKSK